MPLQNFHDLRFPTSVSFGATGGPERRIEVIALQSGREVRNLRQAHALRRYDAGTGLRAISDIEEVLEFYEARRGSFHAFRFRDPFDWKSCKSAATSSDGDQLLGIADGSRKRFELVKAYGAGPDAYLRPITCAVPSTVKVSLDGIAVAAGNFDIDLPGRAVVFKDGHVPAAGKTVSAGFEFDVPVRFDTDALSLSFSGFNSGSIQSIPLREVML
jgi:uncharacterized protein (TIGR02217 family)